ncbi:hypothetical protein HYPSUDRAFT_206046 [Hypholoma sublateritium FD-334 SS-4]|uniref:T6SS Phospholipase effector Tle1-like catalytic domain-containing protein n=1 Tax=Hypholoma sublateritium (strain FD-334 SS-4) TaxID=945553 RepID=A0A0D2KSE3_HYPSF|nr:hypothetical protein HYPSUDRAFT_206046 [Hypholoma sublateritium FD-334 SS-4]
MTCFKSAFLLVGKKFFAHSPRSNESKSGIMPKNNETDGSAVNITTTSSVSSSPLDMRAKDTETESTPNSNGRPELPKFIPTGHSGRTLVLCFDGTGDQFDMDNSNVIAFFTMLKKGDNDNQMVYYQAGIGTYFAPQVATPRASKFSKLLDEAIAWNLHAHLMDGYEFLMQNYKADDRICIFGFSRGAYTARALAGMLHKVGLLPACNHQQVPFAYKMYTNTSEKGWKQANAFKKAFSIDVPIEFLGVWDTVNSVGLIPRWLPFTASNTIVRTFRHAISLDERRAKFKTNLWNTPTPAKLTSETEDQNQANQHKAHDRPTEELELLIAMERKYSDFSNRQTDVEEVPRSLNVWFAGCHCDIGGGSVDNDTAHALARIPLRWMVRECFKANTGIMFDTDGLRGIGLDPHAIYPVVQPRPPPLSTTNMRIQTARDPEADIGEHGASISTQPLSEEDHELRDALSPIYDQLTLARFWWVLEFIPFRQMYGKGDNTVKFTFRWNKGAGRVIPKQDHIVKVHRTVKMRMEATHCDGGKYEPKAHFHEALKSGNLRWVD